jgi:hypothetical protein
MTALKSLQAERRKSAGDLPAETPVEQSEPALQPLPQPAASKPVYPEIGFVPHSLPDIASRTALRPRDDPRSGAAPAARRQERVYDSDGAVEAIVL